MSKSGDANDPKGLIYEAYRIEGITKPDCRTIFLDWALSLPVDRAQDQALAALLDTYGAAHTDHPMTEVLREGRQGIATPRRRGGWRARNGRASS
ncbi:hypothetical protein [uncultured Tateyamaria sp.]|uniref:hypothetical protein n=1 Tax=Tateyamaria sp. 1078 TaxID=3417464 RepID=UPI002634ACC6|nr:hypothetical protein [uncultured Tateyamaria sp.]